MNDLALDKEIQLASQKFPQVFMNKIVKGVFCHIGVQVLFKQRALGVGWCWNGKRQARKPIDEVLLKRIQNSYEVFLGMFFLFILRNIIHKADDELAVYFFDSFHIRSVRRFRVQHKNAPVSV